MLVVIFQLVENNFKKKNKKKKMGIKDQERKESWTTENRGEGVECYGPKWIPHQKYKTLLRRWEKRKNEEIKESKKIGRNLKKKKNSLC